MPVIVFASSKGGPGKTTCSILTASELASEGTVDVTLIDADPNQHSAAWAKKEGCPKNLYCIQNATEENIINEIVKAQARTTFVVVDLEGVASMTAGKAMSQADIIIIPCQGSQNDAVETIKTINFIKSCWQMLGREIPFYVLLNRTSAAIEPKNLKYITESFLQANINLFKCSLIDREAFRSILSFGGTVWDLDKKQVSSVDKAAENARTFVFEIIQKLKDKA